MRTAVLTLTRDRLEYTQHCFAKLSEFAGCEYDHYILDQGSQDGTREWLKDEYDSEFLFTLGENIGISRGMNYLLDRLEGFYDVVVKVDNDCELTQPDTLKVVGELVWGEDVLLSPRILGLQNPPLGLGEFVLQDEVIIDIPQIGGIFLAAASSVYDYYRYPEKGPVWGLDDAHVCRWWRSQGGRCGYVKRLEAWHYQTTSGQHERYPDYFLRTLLEGKPSL